MASALLIICILLAATALALIFRPYVPAAAVAYASLIAGRYSGYVAVSDKTLIFWGAAMLLVLAITTLLPRTLVQTSRGMGYIAGATLAGGCLGLALSPTAITVAAAIGAFLGALAYSRTPAGLPLRFPSSDFLHYLCAKGLPAIVAVSIVGVIASSLI